MPLMYLGSALYVVGCGLIQTLGVGTSTGKWVGYQLLAGGAIGLCVQIPFTALQVVLPEDDIPAGNALMVFLQQLGGSVTVSMAQSIFTNQLRDNLRHLLPPQIEVNMVIKAGPTNIETIAAGNPLVLKAIVTSYEKALQLTFILPTVAAGLGLVACVLLEWNSATGKKKENTEEGIVLEKARSE